MIPADHRCFGRIGAAAVLVHALVEIDPRYPVVGKARRRELLEIKRALEGQAPKGAAPDLFQQEHQDDHRRARRR